ncbi:Ser/Thr protein kinase RdoA (MazF antagonist) [Kribbella aluminosa]|uniref:Ser/Thr protein kinase RdoA (MazF antagonist) n=1 Tax=Kribbella aluminosa TaxID=416017 RepID=A0ABS4UUJ7_9ACTN|nr:phosphotransferase [Kribbella aluminosa]MBP2355224.1 Ser/Thr protein kinase RdoA (MazF antagonist) [Kribbella aluminosa]
MPDETLLLGGTANRGFVVRVGDTVRRPLRASSTATHALLEHLERVGFDGAPRLLGVDSQGREVLSYLPGETVQAPYPAWSMTDEALDSVALLLRAYHEAVADFRPVGLAWAEPVPASYVTGLISHNDPNLDNVVFRDGVAVALIDFDLAGPGSALWDVATAIRLWAPLRPDPDTHDVRRGRSLTRFRRFADTYGLTDADRARLVDAAADNHIWCMDYVRRGAESGHPWFRQRWTTGEAELTDRTNTWFNQSSAAHHQALLH